MRAYLVRDGSEDHRVGHERVSVDQSLRFREVLYRDSEHQLVVEPGWWKGSGEREAKRKTPTEYLIVVGCWIPLLQQGISPKCCPKMLLHSPPF